MRKRFETSHSAKNMKILSTQLGGCLLAALLAAASPRAAAAAIVAAEYYINGDPGPGRGVPITGFTPAQQVSLALDLPVDVVAALSQGMHVITVRFQDEEGDWSVAYTRYFLREDLTIPPASTPMTAAEYYIDTDPGPGNGTLISLPASQWSHAFVIDVPPSTIAALSSGFHRITGRVKNGNGTWSVAFTRGFLKEDLTEEAPPALASHIEYRWMQNSTQVGPSVKLSPTAPATKITFDLLASLQGLTDGGTYQLVATPFDTRGTQGMSATATVKIETIDSDGDGLPDLWELNNGLSPALAADAALDSDADGLSNLAEFIARTNPKAADTSGDGINDKLAIDLGLNPLLQYPSISSTLTGLKGGGTINEEQVRALYPNTPILSRNVQTGKFDLRIVIEQSTGLNAWETLPIVTDGVQVLDGELIYSFSASEKTNFFRVGVSK